MGKKWQQMIGGRVEVWGVATPSDNEGVRKKGGWTNLRFPVLKLLTHSRGGPAHHSLRQNPLGLDIPDQGRERALGRHPADRTRRLDRPGDPPGSAWRAQLSMKGSHGRARQGHLANHSSCEPSTHTTSHAHNRPGRVRESPSGWSQGESVSRSRLRRLQLTY